MGRVVNADVQSEESQRDRESREAEELRRIQRARRLKDQETLRPAKEAKRAGRAENRRLAALDRRSDEQRQSEAGAHAANGLEALLGANITKAIDEFTEAIGLDPHLASLYCARAAAFRSIGRHEDAIQDFGKAIEKDPQDPFLYTDMVDAQIAAQHFAQAFDTFKTMPRSVLDSAVYIKRGRLRQAISDHRGALADYNAALKMEPGNIEAFQRREAVQDLLGYFR